MTRAAGTSLARALPSKSTSARRHTGRRHRDIPFFKGIPMKLNLRFSLALAATLLGTGAFAQTKEVTFAHQDMLVPLRLVMESGEVEKATGYKINWRMFSGGGDVIRAMASGDVQMGEAGSSPLTAAASQGQDIKLFWISADIADAEALVARNGSNITAMKDLVGKKVATPFVSTAHYQLMAGMKMDGVEGKSVNVMNMRPPEIAAAWERGDIDATFIWDPVLSKIKTSGKVIATSGSIGKKGAPTFEGIIVNARWAAANEPFMVAFVKALNRANEEYKATGKSWTADSPQTKAMAKWTKANPADVGPAMALYSFPSLSEQLSPAWLGGGAAKAMAHTAAFLKEQGRVQEVKPDYSAFVTTAYVQKAMAR
jgi:taurine transport system substrate-binding protein